MGLEDEKRRLELSHTFIQLSSNGNKCLIAIQRISGISDCRLAVKRIVACRLVHESFGFPHGPGAIANFATGSKSRVVS